MCLIDRMSRHSVEFAARRNRKCTRFHLAEVAELVDALAQVLVDAVTRSGRPRDMRLVSFLSYLRFDKIVISLIG